MRESSIDCLKRLSKGKFAISVEGLLALKEDLAAISVDDLRAIVAKPARRQSVQKAKPAWLLQIEGERKRLRWKAALATKHLIQAAIDAGLVAESVILIDTKLPPFSAAAQKLAKHSDGDQLLAAFSKEVSRLEREYRLG